MDKEGNQAVLKSPVMTCTVTLDFLTATGTTRKSTTYRTAKLLLGRNQFRDMLLYCESGSTAHKFSLRNFQLHKRFMKEGKATLELKDEMIRVMISNAPPNVLLVLLKTLVGKKATSTGQENKPLGPSAVRQRLLSTEPNTFDEISPLTIKEYQNIRDGGAAEQLKRRAADSSLSSPVSTKRRKKDGQGCGVTPPSKRSLLPPPAAPRPMLLSAEQNRVLRAVQAGHNVFFTGSAGTGKSFLLRRLVGALPPDATAVTASTGVAACHLAGTTLHGFAGIGSGEAPLEQCIAQARRPGVLQNWRRCQHLIIDEVSMVDGTYFEKLEAVARAVRSSDKPFGGIQVILCGDFLQLPPVSRPGAPAKFAFQTTAWQDCVHLNIELTTVRRQDDDAFIAVLQEIRQGRCSEETSNILRSTASHQLTRDGILATRLCTHREDVEHINRQHLESLAGESKVFAAVDTDAAYSKQLDAQTPVLARLVLKVGAQVMLMKNLAVSEGLVNGARGVVQGFSSASGLPIVRWVSGPSREVFHERWTVRATGGLHLSRRQLPLKLAWAFSIHKAQGMTLELVEMSLSRVFEAGQAYVALSRARNLAGLRVLDFSASCIKANPAVLRFYRSLTLADAQ